MVSKAFEYLVNNRIVDHLEKCGLISDFQYGFRSSRSTADLLTVVSERIARAFNRSGATLVVTLDASKTFDRVWHTGLLHKLKVGLSSSKKICVICLIESPLKMMKNAFYFTLKALFVLKIFKFLSQLFGHAEKTACLER